MLNARKHSVIVTEAGSGPRFVEPVKTINFSPSKDDLVRYNKSFTRTLNNPRDVVDIKKFFLEEEIFTIRVTPTGPKLCLLEDLEGDDVEAFLVERKLWWEKWFISIKPWHPSDVDTERMVWRKVMGVPCHARGESLFKVIANEVGS